MLLIPKGTIRQQLRVIILVTVGIALLSASAAMAGFMTLSYRRNLARELGQMAALVEASGTAALAFEDRDQAARALLPLQGREDILAAALYTQGGILLARFSSDDGPRARLPEPGPEHLTFTGGGVRMVKAIRLQGRTIGTLCLAADQAGLRRELGLGIAVIVAIACLSLALASGFAQGLLARLATPLAELAATARSVARRHDYRIRVRPAGNDELGDLMSDFNAMLAQIEQRDQELQAHRERLEDLVRARTAQLERDMEERKALEKQFLRAQRMESLGTLAGGVAHDLNNVLAPILLSIQALQQGTADPDQRRILDLVETAALRGRDVVKQILAFARGIEGQRAPLDFPALAAELEAIIHRTFPKNIALCLDLAPDLAPVVGDATQIHQLLMNLCVNARDAMPAGGTLTLGLANGAVDAAQARLRPGARPGPCVVLTVADTGCGMSPQILDRVFEPFFTTKGVGQGTGLGLSTVHAIARSHGGFVRCASEVGRGTTFQVYLPSAGPGSGPAGTPEDAALALADGAGRQVLVVDDEASVREITRHTLESFGFRVLTARDGREALACYTAHRGGIAAVVMDLMMPVMDGQQAIAALRELDPEVPVVATSGLPDPGSRPGVHGADQFLAKPFDAESLLRALGRALA
jgi:signal transduction histidine kinase/CheY-like chemotaxis protein